MTEVGGEDPLVKLLFGHPVVAFKVIARSIRTISDVLSGLVQV